MSRHPGSEQHYVNLSKVIATSFFVVTSSCASLPRFCLDTQRAGVEWNQSGIEWNKMHILYMYCTRARKYASLICLKASALMWIISWRVVSRVHKARFRKHHRANDAGALTSSKLCPTALPSVVGGRVLGKDAGDAYWEER